MELTVTIFQRRRSRHYEWYTLGLGRLNRAWRGANLAKVESGLAESLRRALSDLYPEAIEALEIVVGRRLQTVDLSFSLSSDSGTRRVHGKFPLVLEPRSRGQATDRTPLTCVYHPVRPDEWFVLPDGGDLPELAAAFFRDRWSPLDDDELLELGAHSRDRLRLTALSVSTKPLSGKLEKKKTSESALLGAAPRKKGDALLRQLAIDETRRAIDGRLPSGMSRPVTRERLAQLLCGRRRVSVLLVGPAGSGKSTLIRQLVHDLLAANDYPSHRNYDKLHPVFRIAGRRIIAGMSYLGQWEQRCVDIVEAARSLHAVLWVEDIAAWGRIGETRESERSLATFFRGPVARGELAIVAECTAEQYQQLLDDAPALASSLTTLFVEPTERRETMRMLLHEARALELAHRVAFDPRALATIYELASTLGAASAFPGRAVDLLRSMATGDDARSLDLRQVEAEIRAGRKLRAVKLYREVSGVGLRAAKIAVEAFMDRGEWPRRTQGVEPPPMVLRSAVADDFGAHPGPSEIDSRTIIGRLARRTGMPIALLDARVPLRAESLERELSSQIMGQPESVTAVAELVLRIKAGLNDPSRPWGVLLFTGPTGTGKTEMAKCLAEYLYGGSVRLLRFDMSEYSDPGAPARLIGDRFRPEGALTSAVRVQPFAVVLLDEVEKADPSVLALMLQLFDDGRLTDATGTVVDFTHVVVIMTSNLGATSSASVGFGADGVTSAHDVAAAVREFFPPELFNRIDRVVPFSPLDREAATAIARRELLGVVSRRGLIERNVFVRFTDAVVDTVVAKAFDPRYGARSLKRWLEDHVGSWLADKIASQPVAGLRVLWLYVRDGELLLHAELLTEAEAFGDPGPFEMMLQWNADRLRDAVPDALTRLDEMLSSPRLTALARGLRERLDASVRGDVAAADTVFNLEGLRGELMTMRQRLATQAEYDPRIIGSADVDARADHEGELVEAQKFSRLRIGADGWFGETFVRVLSPSVIGPSLPMRRRPDFVDELAAFHFMKVAIERADDPVEHTVLLELTRVTRPDGRGRFEQTEPGLLEWLAQAYIERGRGQLEAWLRYPTEPHRETPTWEGGAQRYVLRLVGPAVRTFFATEQGSHVRTSLGGGSEVVRVRVLTGDETPQQHDDRLVEQRAAFVDALQRGTELPANPDAVLPIIRRYRFDPQPDTLSAIEVEDYPLAYAIETRARQLQDVLPQLWLLRIGAHAHVTDGEQT